MAEIIINTSTNTISTGTGGLSLDPSGTEVVDISNGIRIPDGTKTEPAIRLTDDNNTGIFSPAQEQIGITGNGELVLRTEGVASAVNNVAITNATTGNDVIVEAEGTDTDISIDIQPKGAGVVKAGGVEVMKVGDAPTAHSHDDLYYTEAETDSLLSSKADAEDVIIHNGFPNRTDSTISFDNGTRTFTIQPASGSYDLWINGDKVTKSGAENVVIPDTEGIHYIYFNTSGTLVATQTFDLEAILESGTFVATIYWDAVNNVQIYFGDERHGRMDTETHKYLHEAIGAKWISGLALGNITAGENGSLDSHAQVSVADGVIRDEDIRVSISNGSPQTLSPVAQIPLYYKSGAAGAWRKTTATNFPITTTGTGRAAWNEFTGGVWTLSEVGNNDYVLVHLLASPDVEEPIKGIVGQNSYSSSTDAEQGALVELNNLILSGLENIAPELVAIGTLIFQTGDSKSNTVKSSIEPTASGGDYVDWRLGVTSSAGAGTSISDHGSLTGLGDDDHTQYHNDTRGDARYYTQALLDAGQLDTRYYTESEVDALTWDASDVVSGTFADALVAESNVTQHEAALSITESQISDLGSYLTDAPSDGSTYGRQNGAWAVVVGGTDENVKVSANDTTAGYLNGKLVAGTGITLTENNDAGDETLTVSADAPDLGVDDLNDVSITAAAKGDILVFNGSQWVDLTVGTNDQVLTADSAQATGVKWADASGGGGGEDYFAANASGTLPSATGTAGLAIGESVSTSGYHAVCIGTNISGSTKNRTVCIGDSAKTGNSSISIGYGAEGTGDESIHIGQNASGGTGVSGLYAIGLGYRIDATAIGAISIGNIIQNSSAYSFRAGYRTTNVLHLKDLGRLHLEGTQAGYVAPPFASGAEPTAVEGQIIWDSTNKKLKVYNGTSWETITSA